jgi:hypothetical protein
MICPKCRHKNQDDAVICEFCGEPFKVKKPSKKPKDDEISEDSGGFTVKNLKFLGVGILILFVITVAILWPGTHGSINNTDSFISTQASWNQISVYNGTSDDLRSFQIKGDKMRVYITAQPLTQDTNLKCQIYGSNVVASSDDLAWKANDMSLKTMSLQIKTQPGTYSVNIDIPDIPVNQVQWTVQVFDYY